MTTLCVMVSLPGQMESRVRMASDPFSAPPLTRQGPGRRMRFNMAEPLPGNVQAVFEGMQRAPTVFCDALAPSGNATVDDRFARNYDAVLRFHRRDAGVVGVAGKFEWALLPPERRIFPHGEPAELIFPGGSQDPRSGDGWEAGTVGNSIYIACKRPTPQLYKLVGPLRITPYMLLQDLFDEFDQWLRSVNCLSLNIKENGRVTAILDFKLSDYTDVTVTTVFQADGAQ